MPIEIQAAKKKRKRVQNKNTGHTEELDEDQVPARQMDKHMKYTSFVQTKEEVSLGELEDPTMPQQAMKVEPKTETVQKPTTEDPNSLTFQLKQSMVQFSKPSQEAYSILKFKFYTHKKGVHCYHGRLVDIQTSKHEDKNLFRDLLAQKPFVKCIMSPVMKEVAPTHRLGHT